MPNTQLIINGKVQFSPNTLTLEQTRVEIWDNAGTYGLIGTAYTDKAGAFRAYFNSPISDLINNATIIPQYKTFYNNKEVANSPAIQQNITVLTLSEAAFDTAVQDFDTQEIATYLTVWGKITAESGVAATFLTVDVYEQEFRSETLLAQAVTDLNGEYSVKVNMRNIGHAAVLDSRGIIINVTNQNNKLGSSEVVYLDGTDQLQVNLTLDTQNYTPAPVFDTFINKITYVINGTTFSDFAENVDFDNTPVAPDDTVGLPLDKEYLSKGYGNGNGELDYVARAAGCSLLDVQQITRSLQFAQMCDVAHDMMYALTTTREVSANPATVMLEDEMRTTIAQAIENNTISDKTPQEIDDFVTGVVDFQITATKNILITEEQYTIGTVLNSIFGGQNPEADTTQFLQLYGVKQNDIDIFWDEYFTISPTKAELANRGLQLATLTGFQPEMIASLMTDTAQGMYTISEWSQTDWFGYISDVSTQAQKLCVPQAIIGDLTDETEIKTLYAKKLRSLAQDKFPLTGFKVLLQDQQSGSQLIPDAGIRQQAVTFITNNPLFDLRINNVYDINTDNSNVNMTGIQDVEDVQQAMAPIQRMFRLVGGNPDASAKLIIDSLHTYAAISAVPSDDFATSYASLLGSRDAAYAAHAKGTMLAATAMGTFTGMYQSSAQQQIGVFAWPHSSNPPVVHVDPNIKNLFGSTSYCACEQCLSVYSPAAYFTDIMSFLKAGLPGVTPNVYSELIRRRPDLEHIDMTCKNTNTLMPYIDLVIELLEGIILKRFSQPSVAVPPSYQTSGTALELAAHPEHVYKQASTVGGVYTWQYLDFSDYVKAYDPLSYGSNNKNLSNVVYPFNLPFSLPAAETRTYLGYLGYTRYEMMRLFQPYYLPTAISDFDLYSELLGLTAEESKIVSDTHSLSANTWLFYGFTSSAVTNFIDPADMSAPLISGLWSDLLAGRMDILIQQLQVTYKEFLQFLTSDFLNKRVSGTRLITVTSTDPARPDTCDLSKLKLVFAPPATPAVFFNKLHRFIRLWRTGKMSVADWDKIFTSLMITSLNITEFNLIGRVLQFAEKLRMRPTELAGWWYYMDIHQYVDYTSELQSKQPSVYDMLYRNRAVLNLPLPEFHDLGGLDPASIPPGNLPPYYNGFTAAIAAANNIRETDLLLILTYMGITDMFTHAVTLDELSAIYSFSTLCRKTGYQVSDMLKVLYLLDIDIELPVSSQTDIPARLDNLGSILTAIDAINSSSLTLAEIDYLVENFDEQGPSAPAPLNIQAFFEKLRNELQKFPVYTGTIPPLGVEETTAYNKLVNIIYQSFSKEFNVPSEWVATSMQLSDISYLISSLFVTSTVPLTPQEPTVSIYVYPMYKLAYKMAFITAKFRLNTPEFQYLYTQPTTVGFNFANLPVAGLEPQPTVGNLFRGLLQLSRWINVRDRLSLIEDQLVQLLKAAIDEAGDVNVSMAAWQGIINRDQWGNMLIDLIGDPTLIVASTPAGLLNARFPEDFVPSTPASISKLWGMIALMAGCLRTGLKPVTLQATLMQGLIMADSHQVILAAKGKQTEEEWAAIAKPLRDTLRKQQRDALVGFVVARPDPANLLNVQKWRNENDLYAFLLIDVEMESCMKTSRIKQAISSAQLYVDRVLLGLEYRNGNTANRITMPPKMKYQWEQWRSWYRIWEANRKVFLYPENWIEPELRDDKSIFFQEMEDKLFQSDVTDSRAEDALFDYLRRLQEVAKLEPMAVCNTKDPITAKIITHVVARTFEEPHKYFYRRMVYGQWTPWEPLNIEVKGNHLTMIVWRNQLYLFWLTMREKQVPGRASIVNYVLANNGFSKSKWFYHDLGKPNSDTSVNEASPMYIKQIEITVNWSEYKDGQWQEQQIGKEKMTLDLNPIINEYYKKMFPADGPSGTAVSGLPFTGDALKYYNYLTKNRSLNVAELVMSKLSVHSSTEAGDGSVIFLFIQMTNEFSSGIGEYGDNMHTFVFSKDRGVQVWNSWFGGRYNAPSRTAYRNNKFINYYPKQSDGSFNEILWANNLGPTAVTPYCYPAEANYGTLNLPMRYSGYQILLKSPNGQYNVFGYSDTIRNMRYVLQKGFFYHDDKNTFFAQPVQISGTGGALSLAAAAETAAAYYYSGIKYSSFYAGTISLTGVYSTQQFYFQSFFHGRVNDFMWKLNSGGVSGFLDISTQDQNDILNFPAYNPTSIVYGSRVPTNKVDFAFDSAYGGYNWELFFHMPLLIAKRLSDNQQYEDARKWYHYIFDPTCNVDANGSISHSKQRFWRFRPFYDAAGVAISSVDDLLAQIHSGNAAALDQLYTWMDNPFKPHVIARMRILAYMKNVVMCYMDNLIAWADQLYRQDTLESINKATNLYIVVANILGDRPQEVPKRLTTGPRTFSELAAAGLDAFSNAMVGVENYIDPNSGSLYATGTGGGPVKGDTPPLIKLFYYCLPNNPKLLAYWDIIASRLFNIRNCRNINGQVRELPLFDAPIDPALLVRAAAAGIDASSVLDDLSTPPMPYRFTVMLQKANELCNDVKAFGSALLSALEKKDAEELALLRSGHEIAVLESMKRMKQVAIEEASANIEALVKSKDVAQLRLTYYSTRVYKNAREIEHLALLDQAQRHQNAASILNAVASVVAIIPEFNAQVPMSIGPSFGGRELSAVFNALSTIQSMKASIKNNQASKAVTEAGYERRRDDWQFQAESAAKEIIQIEKQIIAAQIRKNMAERDLATQELQITNAKAVDEYMHEKYTNVELYSWMVGQISSSYFQSYQFAYDVAKRAEKNLNFEVPWVSTPGTGFIRFGYWDSLKKGLLSGEKMQYDLRKMEMAYLEANTRELELTKHFSLAMEDPAQLLTLRSSGMCQLICTQDMFDLDYPGHYNRRVKSVSISIPCVAGPYTTIAATLTQSSATIEDAAGAITAGFTSPSIVALSGAQNDSGMFELNLKDERYLPFEGSGALCTWHLSLMDEEILRQFDYNTISDVIIHVKYTAAYSETKRTTRTAELRDAVIGDGVTPIDLPRYFSLKHEFADGWFAFGNAFPTDGDTQMEIVVDAGMFPFLSNGKDITVKQWEIMLKPSSPLSHTYKLEVDYAGLTSPILSGSLNIASNFAATMTLTPVAAIEAGGSIMFKLRLIDQSTLPDPEPVNMSELLDDIYVVATYNLSLP